MLVIPFVADKLAPETRVFGEQLGARFVDVPGTTGYWDLVAELWSGDEDFIVVEEDVLPTAEMIRDMEACTEPWCSGHYGHFYVERQCRRIDGPKPCGEPPAHCGHGVTAEEARVYPWLAHGMTEERSARIAECPLRGVGPVVVRSDSWLGCVKFGQVRRRLPDLLARAAKHFPTRAWWLLDRGLFAVLYDEESVGTHLHWPALRHLKLTAGSVPGHLVPLITYDSWTREQFEQELAAAAGAGG